VSSASHLVTIKPVRYNNIMLRWGAQVGQAAAQQCACCWLWEIIFSFFLDGKWPFHLVKSTGNHRWASILTYGLLLFSPFRSSIVYVLKDCCVIILE
jgi:hypothetical protein